MIFDFHFNLDISLFLAAESDWFYGLSGPGGRNAVFPHQQIFRSGVVHKLCNHFWGSRKPPPSLYSNHLGLEPPRQDREDRQDRLFSRVKRPFFTAWLKITGSSQNWVFCVSSHTHTPPPPLPPPLSHKVQNVRVWNWLRYCLKWEWLCLKSEKVGRCTTPLHSWHQWWTGTVRKERNFRKRQPPTQPGSLHFLQKSLSYVFVHNFFIMWFSTRDGGSDPTTGYGAEGISKTIYVLAHEAGWSLFNG